MSNEIFTTPPSQHDQNAPSSSHPPTSIPPSQPTIHTSLTSKLHSPHSPHIDPSSSPFYNPTSSSHHDSKSSNSEEDIEATRDSLNEVHPFPKTYRRGYRHLFSSLGVKGAMPSSSKQHVDKGKEKVIEPTIHDEEDNHQT